MKNTNRGYGLLFVLATMATILILSAISEKKNTTDGKSKLEQNDKEKREQK